MTWESALEHACCRHAKRRGWFSIKLKAPGCAGLPDRLFAKNERAFFVEFKRPGGRATPLQFVTHRLMQAHGLRVYVIDSAVGFHGVIEKMESRA